MPLKSRVKGRKYKALTGVNSEGRKGGGRRNQRKEKQNKWRFDLSEPIGGGKKKEQRSKEHWSIKMSSFFVSRGK